MKPLNFSVLLRYSLILVSFSIFEACQSSPIKEFNKITLGNDKSDVIELIGGPNWYDRREGTDRWTYIIFQDGVQLEREIRFSEGIVAYVGEPVKPFITAAEQDSINAEKNLYLDRMERNNFTPISYPKNDSKDISR